MKLTDWQITGHTVPYWFRAPNLAVAAAVVLAIGGGRFGLKELGGEGRAMPPGNNRVQVNAWVKRNLGMGVQEMHGKLARQWIGDYIHALESVRLGMPGEEGLVPPRVDLTELAHRAAEKTKRALADRLREQRAGAH